jgi:hypothetical protein
MAGTYSTYSFKDLTGVLVNPVFGASIVLTGGNIGMGSVTIAMTTERTVHDTSADGSIMGSYIAGNNGTVDIEVQQTSALHHQLLDLYNLAIIAANNEDVSGWMATTISFRAIYDGSVHILSGVSFGKLPDKPYQAAGQKIRWALLAADSISM